MWRGPVWSRDQIPMKPHSLFVSTCDARSIYSKENACTESLWLISSIKVLVLTLSPDCLFSHVLCSLVTTLFKKQFVKRSWWTDRTLDGSKDGVHVRRAEVLLDDQVVAWTRNRPGVRFLSEVPGQSSQVQGDPTRMGNVPNDETIKGYSVLTGFNIHILHVMNSSSGYHHWWRWTSEMFRFQCVSSDDGNSRHEEPWRSGFWLSGVTLLHYL